MYPTKEEILRGKGPPIKTEQEIIRQWKEQHYKEWLEKDSKTKNKAIKILLNTINDKREGKTLKITFNKEIPSCYNPKKRLIILESNSIITALHELGHHLFGSSELKACRYSTWIFKRYFPQSFNKLEFKGHLLIKK